MGGSCCACRTKIKIYSFVFQILFTKRKFCVILNVHDLCNIFLRGNHYEA